MGELTKVLALEDDNWKVFCEQIPDGDEDQADKPLAIITSIGSFGIGKSFLQNALLGAVRMDESYFEEETRLLEVFPIETSVKSETKGIDMFSEYLEPPLGADEMVLALWDTEGPSDPNQPQDHAITIFALSAYFSRVLIYNVKEKFTAENMDKMQVYLEEMRTLSGGGENAELFQTLIIVVRDADEEFGYCWEGGKAYLEHMKTEGRLRGQTEVFFRELENTFRTVLVFMMPPPNQEVKTKGIKVTHMRDIDLLFRESLRIFAKQLLYEIVLESGNAIDREVLRVCNLKAQLTKIAERFQNMSERRSTTLANARKEEHTKNVMNACFEEYQRELLENRGWFQAEATRTERHNELKRKTLENFRAAIERHYLEVQIVDAALQELEKLLDERFKAYNDSAHKAQLTMWIVGGVVIGAGAIAAIVCFPTEAAALGRAVRPQLIRLATQAIPHIMPHVQSATDAILGSSNLPISSSVMAVVTGLATQHLGQIRN